MNYHRPGPAVRVVGVDGEVPRLRDRDATVAHLLAEALAPVDGGRRPDVADELDDVLGSAALEERAHLDGRLATLLGEVRADVRCVQVLGGIDAPVLHSPSVASMGNPHAIFWVDDVEALFQELKASGADIIEGPTRRIYDCVEMEVRDCNGFKLVFSQG